MNNLVKEIGKEAIVLVGGAIVAAYVVGQFPNLKKWIQDQWGDANRKIGG
jgi:hypothetical protein